MAGNSTALIFSTDETYAPLAKGLVLSLVDKNSINLSLCLVDIGCSPETLTWMKEHGVTISAFDRAKYLPIKLNSAVKQYQDAQLCRPFLPSIFPDHEVYLWCDSDIWIQNIESLNLYIDIAKKNPEKVAISPLIDVSYKYHFADGMEFMRYARHWFRGCYGATIAETYADHAILSSGLFAMRMDNPIWSLWASELIRIFEGEFEDHYQSHLAEQTVLNYLVYSRGALGVLEALHNYNCHIGSAVRRNGAVVVDAIPYRKIGAVHLTYSSKMLPEYLRSGLLYKEGSYLSDVERASLSNISHY
ncbi:MAG: hypothetical protein WDN02_06800 [Methylovirgula sp.]|uniref:hypothetical protein n=1 Tax=Methylovirgula sp. TaxID=1978224 RepID=UPI00307640BF